MSKFDSLSLPVDKPGKLILVHPISRQPLRDAEGNEAYIELYSGDSEIARKHARTVTRRRLATARGGRLTPEELEADAVDLLAALTASWHLIDLNGQTLDVEFTQQNARELYLSPGTAWLREQVDEFTGTRANFSQPSPKN